MRPNAFECVGMRASQKHVNICTCFHTALCTQSVDSHNAGTYAKHRTRPKPDAVWYMLAQCGCVSVSAPVCLCMLLRTLQWRDDDDYALQQLVSQCSAGAI